MSLDKAIEHGKEHRKQYTGAKAVDPQCRNHGSCKYCEDGRHHRNLKRKIALDYSNEEYERYSKDGDDECI